MIFLCSFLCELLISNAQNAPQTSSEPLAYGGPKRSADSLSEGLRALQLVQLLIFLRTKPSTLHRLCH